jgi:hypothetical protein
MLWWIGRAAADCVPTSAVSGFDEWVDGATDVPTDARIVVLGGSRGFDLTLTRADTLEVVATSGDFMPRGLEDDVRVAYTPVTALAPRATYRADITDRYGASFSATFTTGDGPTPTDLPAPILDAWEATGWRPSAGYACRIEPRARSPRVRCRDGYQPRSPRRPCPLDRPENHGGSGPTGSPCPRRSPW